MTTLPFCARCQVGPYHHTAATCIRTNCELRGHSAAKAGASLTHASDAPADAVVALGSDLFGGGHRLMEAA